MSYTRKYKEVIVVEGTASDTVAYPASSSGGTKRVHIKYIQRIPVEIHIHVDTEPFDKSVVATNKEVIELTQSIVATEAAQVASKIDSAESISTTIVDGFYGLIRSEIRQQIMEIKPRVEALLMEMIQHQEAVLAKKQQFQGDFLRIAERYTKIFNELDKELRNRVMRLNESATGVFATLSESAGRSLADINPGQAAIHHKEGGHLRSVLLAGGLKDRARSLLLRSGIYLDAEALLKRQFEHVLAQDKMADPVIHAVPVLYFEGRTSADAPFRDSRIPDRHRMLQMKKERIEGLLFNDSLSWSTINPYHLRRLNEQMERELDEAVRKGTVTKETVKERIRTLMERNAEMKSNQ